MTPTLVAGASHAPATPPPSITVEITSPFAAEADAPAVVVVAASGAARAQLAATLAAAGLTVSGVAPSPASAADVPGDVVVVLLADPAIEFASDRPTVVIGAPGSFSPGPAAAPRAYLEPGPSPIELAAAVHAVLAGLTLFDPGSLAAAFASRARTAAPLASGADSDERLTPREIEVLEQLAAGLPNKGIARRLGISENTVKYHVAAILAKLEAQSRAEAVMLAARRGLIPL